MMQSGMAQWVPHGDADHSGAAASQHGDSSPTDSHSEIEPSGHGSSPDATGNAPLRDWHAGRCYLPEIGCGCPGCIDYFNAHAFTLPTVSAAVPQVVERGPLEADAIALFAGLNVPPPTPPPRL